KRRAVSVENASGTFDNQPVQIVRPDNISKGFAQTVEKIEDEIFFDLDLLFRALELANPPALPLISDQPPDERDDKQPKEEKAHGAEIGLLRWALVMEVLLEIFENVFESVEIFRR